MEGCTVIVSFGYLLFGYFLCNGQQRCRAVSYYYVHSWTSSKQRTEDEVQSIVKCNWFRIDSKNRGAAK